MQCGVGEPSRSHAVRWRDSLSPWLNVRFLPIWVLLDNDAVNLFEARSAAAREPIENVGARFERMASAVDVGDRLIGKRTQKRRVRRANKGADGGHVFADTRSHLEVRHYQLPLASLAVNDHATGQV